MHNTLISYNYIKNNASDWQSHLQRISDFLIFGEDVWWKKTEFGVEFIDKDGDFPCQKPLVRHFRSTTIADVEVQLEKNWAEVLAKNIPIPANSIIEEDETGNGTKITPSSFLLPFLSPQESGVPILNENSKNNNNELSCINEDDTNDLIGICDNSPTIKLPSNDPNELTNSSNENETLASMYIDNDNTHEREETIDICEKNEVDITISEVPVSKKTKMTQHKENNKENVPYSANPKVPKTASTKSYKMQTTEGKNISFVLNKVTDDIIKYDKFKVESKKKNSTILKDDMLDLLAPIQTKVMRTVRKLEKEIENWERQYIADNQFCAPTLEIKLKNESGEIFITQKC